MRTGGTGDVYYGIVAESYDLWFPGTDFEDSDFYRRMIEAVPGPALEVGCGTGRPIDLTAKPASSSTTIS